MARISRLSRREVMAGGAAATIAGVAATRAAAPSATPTAAAADGATPSAGSTVRRDVGFGSRGARCVGWLYLPANLAPGERVPGVVMANAFSALRGMILPGYAERFAGAGFAALAFDYRYLGESEGEPRDQVLPAEQHLDLRNAITWLRARPEIDPERIGGWGVSLGGSHMLFLGAFDRRLKAVVATATGISSVALVDATDPSAFQQRLLALNTDRDERFRTGSAATYLPAVGPAGSPRAMPFDEAYEFYGNAMRTFAPTYPNRVTVESVEASFYAYDPDFAVHLISPTPLLIVHAEHDPIPTAAVRAVFERAREPKRMLVLDCRHTDLYDKEPWITRSADAAIAWFREHLG